MRSVVFQTVRHVHLQVADVGEDRIDYHDDDDDGDDQGEPKTGF